MACRRLLGRSKYECCWFDQEEIFLEKWLEICLKWQGGIELQGAQNSFLVVPTVSSAFSLRFGNLFPTLCKVTQCFL